MTSKVNHPLYKRVDRRLLIRLRIYLLIFLAQIGVTIFNIFEHRIDFGIALIGVLTGTLIGAFVGRIYQLRWDEKTEKLIAKIDWIGGLVLILYIVYLFNRGLFIGRWVQADTLAVIGISITAGIMLGRIVFTRHGIRTSLMALGILNN